MQATIAAVLPHGLNVKFLGFFDGTVDLYHIPLSAQAKAEKGGVDLTKAFKVGKKVKARLLWNAISPQTGSQVFSMSLLPHLVFPSQSANLSPAIIKQAFPTGRILEHVNVLRVEPEFGLVCGIPGPSSSDPVVPAFVHVCSCKFLENIRQLILMINSSPASQMNICNPFLQVPNGKQAPPTALESSVSVRSTTSSNSPSSRKSSMHRSSACLTFKWEKPSR